MWSKQIHPPSRHPIPNMESMNHKQLVNKVEPRGAGSQLAQCACSYNDISSGQQVEYGQGKKEKGQQ